MRTLLAIFFFGFFMSHAQQDSISGISKLRLLINQKNLSKAATYLDAQLTKFREAQLADSLVWYTEYVGSYSLNHRDWKAALSKASAFVEELLAYNNIPVSKLAYKELAWIQSEAGRPDLAYDSMIKALEFAKKDDDNKFPTVDDIYYNMGYYAAEMGNYVSAKRNYTKSKEYFEKKAGDKDYVALQQVYNALGGIMWREAKMDSCNYYFAKSLEALKQTDPDLMNSYFRPGLVLMNMAVVSNALGKNYEAVRFSENAITNFQQYIKEETNEQQKNAALGNLLVAIDNLGSFYNSIGEFNKAETLIAYSYQQKQQNREPDDPNVIISEILLAQAKLNTRDLEGAKALLETALTKIENNPGIQDFWRASAFTTLANVLQMLGENEQAVSYFERGIDIFLASTNGFYSTEILTELSNLAVFLAQLDYKEAAIKRAEELYREVKKGQFNNTSQGLQFLNAVAETHYQLEDYRKAQAISQDIIDGINKELMDQSNSKDAVLKSLKLPRAILLNSKSKYALSTDKSMDVLESLSNSLEPAFKTLQLRQTILQNYDDVSILISQNTELIEFAKSLQLEMYQKSGDQKYLDKLIALHESSIYNRIRARLNLKENQAFNSIPATITDKENELKSALTKSLGSSSDEGITDFIDASQQWEDFRELLKKEYPEYFNLKYGSLLQNNSRWKTAMESDKTYVRYIFVDKVLYSLTITKDSIHLTQHDYDDSLSKLIERQQEAVIYSNKNPQDLNQLYKALWNPIESLIKTDKLVILPDGNLFNLSFDVLTKTPISDYKELQTESLLAKHSISYQFSLFLLSSNRESKKMKRFVAFAPTFEQKMKDKYLETVGDTLSRDQTYLSLLPQPFITELAKKYGRLFSGDVYTGEKASKSLFLTEASNHKIIHIGTHAESNNLSPELSKLIFAKTLRKDSINENDLYAYEIYNHNLTSDLAILTACETGKPSFKPGEGMISLTHAFTFSGSKSILTSLWKVDEKSSAEIASSFLDGLSEGLPKDEALREAKLNYISSATSRTAAIEYWSGLVLIGDTAPLELEKSNSIIWILILIGGLLFFGLRYRSLFKKNS
ncbi:MAG: CHAT domain-containing protein [Bacteroidota bacterium]